MKVYVLVLLCSLSVYAEPPVQYSTTFQDSFAPPPAPLGSFASPSASYGVPSQSYEPSSGFRGRIPAPSRQTTAVLRPSSNYGAPPPTYRAPPQSFRQPSASYGVPSTIFGGHSSGQSTTSSSFSSHSAGTPRPSPSYGAPSRYRTQFSGYGGQEDYGEAAPYSFEYRVHDAASGNDFGHQESRQGQLTRGTYMVLLPDGRRQIVEYEADENGYRPTIRYEDTGRGAYTGGRQGGYNY